MSVPHRVTRTNHSARTLARGLGWFSIGLGLAEVLMPGKLARFLGVPENEGLIRACGARARTSACSTLRRRLLRALRGSHDGTGRSVGAPL